MKNGFEISEQTYAFITQGDEEVEVAHCHPAFYCTKVNGVYRTPLPPLSDREIPALDFEDELIARLDGDVVDEEELEAQGFDDLFEEDDQEHTAAWIDEIDRAAERYAAPKAATALPAVAAAPVVVAPKAAAVLTDDRTPRTLSARRAVLTGPKTVLKETGPDDHSWKGNTRQGRQFARHH